MTNWLSLMFIGAAAAATPGPAPQELVGAWHLQEENGSSQSVWIDSAGRFERVSTTISISRDCDTRVVAAATGRMSVEGSLLHLDDEAAKFRSINTCRPRWDYEKPGPAGRNSYRWRIEHRVSSPVLILKPRSGPEQRYYKR